MTDYTDLSASASSSNLPRAAAYKLTPEMEKKVKYMHDTIHDELNTSTSKLCAERETLKVPSYVLSKFFFQNDANFCRKKFR